METLRHDREVLGGLGEAAGERVQDMYDNGNDGMRRVWRSYVASRENTLRFDEQAVLDGSTLEFAFQSRGFG